MGLLVWGEEEEKGFCVWPGEGHFYQVKGLSLPPFSEELVHGKTSKGIGSVPTSVHKDACILK